MKKPNLKIYHLIVGVALLSFIMTIFIGLFSSYRLNTQTLVGNSLETNRVYAQKLADTAEDYLKDTLQSLSVSASEISKVMDNPDELLHEANVLKSQSNTFNSVIISNVEGVILATSPQELDIKGQQLTSEASQRALKERKPIISKPYESLTGRLIIFISHPIFDNAGQYLGLVGGTIYLKEQNILYKVLGQHYYNDGSYVYVVDEDGRVIYHQDSSRINEQVSENKVVQQLMRKQNGAKEVVNTKGVEMLAGYAVIPTANWGVVSQRPKKMALAPAANMMKKMLIYSLPLLAVSLLIIFVMAMKIAQPLQQLAKLTEKSMEQNEVEKISQVPGWYYEVRQLKKALIHSLSFLHSRVSFFKDQSTTDPLTGLMNRRTMNELMQQWVQHDKPFAVIMLDIDHFKRVNDTYGHNVGDDVLQFLASQMKDALRDQDICCRLGGEEFLILLPETTSEEAYQIADQLRCGMENTVSPCGDIVTVSGGVAVYPADATSPTELIEIADQYLYQAKTGGRNRIVSTQLSLHH